MANYGWIKATEVIDLVKSELKTLNEQGRIVTEDCLQWVVDAIREIGTPHIFEEQWALTPIKNHTGIIPNDVFQVDVAYRISPNDFNTHIQPILTTEVTVNFLSNEQIKKIIHTAFPLKYGGTEMKLLLLNKENVFISPDESYILQGRRVITSYKEGFFMVSYLGLYLDEDGIPMIPDDIDTIQAVKAYIRYKLFEEPFYMQVEGAQAPYLEARTTWENKKAMAQNTSLIPDIGEAIERVNETSNRYWKFRMLNAGLW